MTSIDLTQVCYDAQFVCQLSPADGLDLLYAQFDDALLNGRYDEVDHVLATLPVDAFDVDVLLGLLIISNWAQAALPSRRAFFGQVEQHLRQTHKYQPALLAGLEPKPDYR